MERVFTVTETGCKDVRWIEENNEVLRGKKCIVENVHAVRQKAENFVEGNFLLSDVEL
jgi:hypothetical protein